MRRISRKLVCGRSEGQSAAATAGLLSVAGLAAAGALAPSELTALQDAPGENAWRHQAELTLLLTSGNATARTFGLGGTSRREWARGELSVVWGALRTVSGPTRRIAVGTVEDYVVEDVSDTEPTAEDYFLRGEFEGSLSEDAHLKTGVGVERNTFAGFESRLSAVAGIGNTWFESDGALLKTDYGLTLTAQNDVVEDPSKSATFGGVRVSTDFRRRLTETADLEARLVLDENLVDTADLRADFSNSVNVRINHMLAVKTGLRLRWDNEPALVEAILTDPGGGSAGETVLVPRHELDTTLTLALVANF